MPTNWATGVLVIFLKAIMAYVGSFLKYWEDCTLKTKLLWIWKDGPQFGKKSINCFWLLEINWKIEVLKYFPFYLITLYITSVTKNVFVTDVMRLNVNINVT